jgi:hypothetical protein
LPKLRAQGTYELMVAAISLLSPDRCYNEPGQLGNAQTRLESIIKAMRSRPGSSIALARVIDALRHDIRTNPAYYIRTRKRKKRSRSPVGSRLANLVSTYIQRSRPTKPDFECYWTEDNGLWYTPWVGRRRRVVLCVYCDGMQLWARTSETQKWRPVVYEWCLGRGLNFGKAHISTHAQLYWKWWDITVHFAANSFPLRVSMGQEYVFVEADNALSIFRRFNH